jgi:hypothetical protein
MTSQWNAGQAQVCVTPAVSIWLDGWGSRSCPSSGFDTELYVKALVIQDQAKCLHALITSDTLDWPEEICVALATYAKEKYGIERSQIFLNASHTHSGPRLRQDNHFLFPKLPEGQHRVIAEYAEAFVGRAMKALDLAIGSLKPAVLKFGQGLAGIAVNRRRASDRLGGRSRPAIVDQDVPVLTVEGIEGALKAIVFGYACHNTSTYDDTLTGDYSGYAQRQLEERFPDTVTFFVAGCGADANPLPRLRDNLGKIYGKILALAVQEVIEGDLEIVSGHLKSAYDVVALPYQTPPALADLQSKLNCLDGANRRAVEWLIAMRSSESLLPTNIDYPIQVWQLGEQLTWILLTGEVVADYSLRLKKKYGWDSTWVSGYCNQLFAYIPSYRVWCEGDYEGKDGMILFGHPAPFQPAVEELIIDKVEELIQLLPDHT